MYSSLYFSHRKLFIGLVPTEYEIIEELYYSNLPSESIICNNFFFFTKTLQLKLLYSWHDDHFKSINICGM